MPSCHMKTAKTRGNELTRLSMPHQQDDHTISSVWSLVGNHLIWHVESMGKDHPMNRLWPGKAPTSWAMQPTFLRGAGVEGASDAEKYV